MACLLGGCHIKLLAHKDNDWILWTLTEKVRKMDLMTSCFWGCMWHKLQEGKITSVCCTFLSQLHCHWQQHQREMQQEAPFCLQRSRGRRDCLEAGQTASRFRCLSTFLGLRRKKPSRAVTAKLDGRGRRLGGKSWSVKAQVFMLSFCWMHVYLGAEPELLPAPAEGEADDSHPVGTGKAASSCHFHWD